MDTSITLPASCEPKSSVRHSDRSESQTVLRACEVLKTFHAGELELSSAEVIRRTHLPKTTVLRLLRTLVHGGVLERSSGGIYRSAPLPFAQRSLRIGFASQDDSEFARTILQHLQVAAAREHVHLITVDNRYSAREAIRNAEYLIRQEVDLVLEFQTYERIAPILASKFMQAKTPVIAIDIPHPGATYFGANNHRAGVMGGRALGRWAREHWNDRVDRLLILELPIAGPLVELRMQGFLSGLHLEHPTIANVPMIRLNGRGEFEEVYDLVRQFLRRSPVRRTLVGTVNDTCALAALRAFEDAGAAEYCAVVGQNGVLEARTELRRAGTRMIGTVAHFPERYGNEVLALAKLILQKKLVPSEVFTRHQFISARNVDLIYPLDKPA